MLGPDDTYSKAPLSLKSCRELLKASKANLASTDEELRQQATETLRQFTELQKMITTGKTHTLDGNADASISSLVGLLDVIRKDAANNASKDRQRLAVKTLNDIDKLAAEIAKATKTAAGRVA